MRSILPWKWVPSLYFSEGVPYAIIASVSVILLKDLQMSNRELAFLSSLLTLPWVLKPLWAPLIDLIWTKKIWFVAMELLMGAGFLACGSLLPVLDGSLTMILILLGLAVASATHDAAADGFYLLGLAPHEQAYFTGIRSTAYRIAMVTAQGGLVMLVGFLQNKGFAVRMSWAGGLAGAGGLMALLG
ncbi:MAG: MFS transporter, partial [Lentisphaeria bacterium]|nr:MFS transporter [Lentisphaeria bacterium]